MGVNLAQDDNGRPIQVFGLGAAQDVAIGATSVQSTAFGAGKRIIRVNADVNCRIATGPDPIATADSARLIANTTEHFKVEVGDKIAVIQETDAGTLSVTECT